MPGWPRWTVLLALVPLGSLGCAASGGQPGADLTRAPDPTLVAHAVLDRVEAGDVPDQGLLPASGPLFVVRLGQEATIWRELTSASFEGLDREVIVTTRDSLESISRARGGERVPFLGVGPPQRADDGSWTIILGGDFIVYPAGPKLCCCMAEAHFELTNTLEFQRWGFRMCA